MRKQLPAPPLSRVTQQSGAVRCLPPHCLGSRNRVGLYTVSSHRQAAPNRQGIPQQPATTKPALPCTIQRTNRSHRQLTCQSRAGR